MVIGKPISSSHCLLNCKQQAKGGKTNIKEVTSTFKSCKKKTSHNLSVPAY